MRAFAPSLLLALSTLASAAEPTFAEALESSLDRTVDPCADFYQYACGGWIANTVLPSDKSRYTRSFSVIADRNEELLHGLLEQAAKDPGEDANLAKVGAVYGSCMDEAAVDAAGVTPIEPLLAQIDAATDLAGLAHLMGELALVDVSIPVGIGVYGDFDDPNLNILHMGQSGLGLPDRDYYLELDEDGQKLLSDYQAHVALMLQKLGASAEQATADAAAIVAFEGQLAAVHLPRADLRDPTLNYHRVEREGAVALFKSFPLDQVFAGMGYADLKQINVERPEVFEATDKVLAATELATLKAYLRWHLLDATAGSLSSDLVAADFAFFGKRLRGQAEDRPRWKKCVGVTQGHLGDVLSQLYVERAFAGESKAKADEMILDIETAFQNGLDDLAWMDDETRARAKEKVATLDNKIGYPKKWKDFSGLNVAEGGYFDKVLAMRRFTSTFELNKVGNAVDRDEWFMSASDVNAYYNPLANEMAFPAGILQPPFFDASFPAAANYGAIGMVMGHELTHGFDDTGAMFDPQGKMVQWWAPEATERFKEATDCVVNQYDRYEVQPGLAVKGELTQGENIADLGGIKETYDAYHLWVDKHGAEPELAGFTGDQVVFLAFAQGWCSIITPEVERERIATDTHSPPRFRVNGPLADLPAFGQAFGCKKGSPMRPKPKNACTVW